MSLFVLVSLVLLVIGSPQTSPGYVPADFYLSIRNASYMPCGFDIHDAIDGACAILFFRALRSYTTIPDK